jgi:hypothetical protein
MTSQTKEKVFTKEDAFKESEKKDYDEGFNQGKLSTIEDEIKFLKSLHIKADLNQECNIKSIDDLINRIKQLNKQKEELKK